MNADHIAPDASTDGLLNPYTVIYTVPGHPFWQGFNAQAEDPEHAEEQCLDAHPDASIVWINEGHGNFDCNQ